MFRVIRRRTLDDLRWLLHARTQECDAHRANFFGLERLVTYDRNDRAACRACASVANLCCPYHMGRDDALREAGGVLRNYVWGPYGDSGRSAALYADEVAQMLAGAADRAVK